MEHRKPVGFALRNAVDDVETEVELFGILEGYINEVAVFVLFGGDEVLVDVRRVAVAGGLDRGFLLRGNDFVLGRLFVKESVAVVVGEDCEEFAGLAVGGDHSVRGFAVIVDAVAAVENLDVAADVDFQSSVQNVVELDAAVRR